MSQMSHSNIKRLIVMSQVIEVAVELQEDQCLHFSRQQWLDIMSPAVLKSLSDGTPVGGGARNFCTGGDN